MAIEDLIYTRLSGFAGLAALVGARIYPDELPQDVAVPAVVYSLVADDTPQPQQVTGQTDLIRARYQFDCWAETPLEARNVRLQLRLALKRWATAGPPVVQSTFALSQINLQDRDTRRHNFSADFEINYEE